MKIDAEIKVEPEILLLYRIEVLDTVTRTLAEGFGCEGESLNTIKKGITERQVIKKIFINYLNDDNKLVGRVTIEIDWKKHRVLADADKGPDFEIDSKQSIIKQISIIYPKIIEHTNNLRKAYKIKRIETQYSYTNDVWKDPIKLNETRKFLGTSPGKDIEWAKSIKNNFEIEFASKKLEELKIRIEHDKSPV